MSMVLSLLSAKNPIDLASGDQKRLPEPEFSVPASLCAASESSERTQSELEAEKTTRRPSGEIAGSPPSNVIDSGGTIEILRSGVSPTGAVLDFQYAVAKPAVKTKKSPATAHATLDELERGRSAVVGAGPSDRCCWTHRSSPTRSPALCQRSSGSLARHRCTTWSRYAGVIGRRF